MVKPTRREERKISKISKLEKQVVQDLKDILFVLGFDFETIGLLWDKTTQETEAAFVKCQLNGADLAFFCTHIGLRPAVVQRKLNFDYGESRIGTRKIGHKSTRAPLSWCGPPELCLNGSVMDGKVFREVFQSVGTPLSIIARGPSAHKILQQISNGNLPVRLPQLIETLDFVRKANALHRKTGRLEAILDSFPKGIQTVENVFAPAETQINRPEEEHTMNQVDVNFANNFAAAGMSQKLADLIEKEGLTGWVYNNLQWDDDAISQFADGESGPLPDQLENFLSYCDSVHVAGELIVDIRSYWEENSDKEQSEQKASEPAGSTEGHWGELWYSDRVVFAGVSIPHTGKLDESLSKRVYATLLAVQKAGELQWADVQSKMGLSRENILALQSGAQKLTPDFLRVFPSALKKHFGHDLTIEEVLGIDTLPSLVEPTVSEETTPSPARLDSAYSSSPSAAAPLEQSENKSAHESEVMMPANGWPQKEISKFISIAIERNDALRLGTVLGTVGLNAHANSQVLRGKRFYSTAQLRKLAPVLGVSFADLATANKGVLDPVVSESGSKMVDIGKRIAALIQASPALTTWDVLKSAGIRYRPHNAAVIKGHKSYTSEQLRDIANSLGVTVAVLEGAEKADAPNQSQSTPGTEQVESVQDTVAAKPVYDPSDKNLRKVVVAQLKKLKARLGVTGADFLDDVRVTGHAVLYGNSVVSVSVLEDVVKKYQLQLPWLTFDWFLTGAEFVAPAKQVQSEVAPEPKEATSTMVRDSSETSRVTADISPAEVSVGEVNAQLDEVSLIAEEAAPIQESEPDVVSEVDNSVVHLTETDSLSIKQLDWRKLFFVFAKAGYVEGAKVAALLEPFTTHSDYVVDWTNQVLAVAGPVLRSAHETTSLSDITQDVALAKVLSNMSAFDLLVLSRALEQASRTQKQHVA
jgi:hypothetical protein